LLILYLDKKRRYVMRKDAKNARRTKCSYAKCTKDSFRKNLGYYYKGRYYCGKSHARRAKQENAIKE